LGTPNGEAPKAIEYIGKIAVKTISLGPEIAAGSSPARATKKMHQAAHAEPLSELIAQLPPCLIGMEACSGAHEWARRFSSFGHTVRLMAPKLMTPYRKSGKNDGSDAEGRGFESLSHHQNRARAAARSGRGVAYHVKQHPLTCSARIRNQQCRTPIRSSLRREFFPDHADSNV